MAKQAGPSSRRPVVGPQTSNAHPSGYTPSTASGVPLQNASRCNPCLRYYLLPMCREAQGVMIGFTPTKNSENTPEVQLGTVVDQVAITPRIAANDRRFGALNLRKAALHDSMCHGSPAGQEPVKFRLSAFAVITGMRSCLSGSRISSSVAGAESRFERLMNADH